jgi:hypothetical protein
MSHGGDLPDTCKYGHILETWKDDDFEEDDVHDDIRDGKITSLEKLRDEESAVSQLFGEWKSLKTRTGSQGTALAAVFTAVDDLDDKGFDVKKVGESVFVTPQSNMHAEFMQRKQQAEQNIKQTMQTYQELIKQKHMLQHDIRKLRSRVEALNAQDENLLKGDFIELVDGAGQSPRQGGDQMSLKAYRDQNIYPSIVADFNEMDSTEDLLTAEQKAREHEDKDAEDFEDGLLANIPENEKAILKKKYKMYERWKDLYGSEIERKLNDLKGQMKNIQRSIEETEEWLKPYVRDVNKINKMETDIMENQQEIAGYLETRGASTQVRTLEYIMYRGMRKDEESGELTFAEDEEPTHYRIIFVRGIHANLASFSQPQSPADGPSSGTVKWMPGLACKHVFENIIEPRINEFENEVEQMMNEYTGDFELGEKAEKLKEARQSAQLSVRQLREEVNKKAEESDEMNHPVPLQLSSQIRRVEDGLESLEEAIDEKYIEAIEEILKDEVGEEGLTEEPDEENHYTSFQKKYKKFFGHTGPFYLEKPQNQLKNHTRDLRYDYYWGLKLGLGMYTMK